MSFETWQKLPPRTRTIVLSAAGAIAAIVLAGTVILLVRQPSRAPASDITTSQSAKTVAQDGDLVSIDYTGTLDDGTVFDTSVGRKPLNFLLGRGKVIEGFDKAVAGMTVGETKKVHISVEEAYGAHDETLVQKVERSKLPADLKLEVGQMLEAHDDAGQVRPVKVLAFDDQSVTLDENHPLAGQALNFEIKLVAIH